MMRAFFVAFLIGVVAALPIVLPSAGCSSTTYDVTVNIPRPDFGGFEPSPQTAGNGPLRVPEAVTSSEPGEGENVADAGAGRPPASTLSVEGWYARVVNIILQFGTESEGRARDVTPTAEVPVSVTP